MSNSSGMNFDARSAPAGAAPRKAPLSFPCTTAAFTLSRAPVGLRHVACLCGRPARRQVLTRPGTRPSMRSTRPIPGARPSGRPAAVQNRSRRFGLSVGSHVYGPRPCGPPCGPAFGSSNPLLADWCARASFRHSLAGLPLPSAGRYIRPHRGPYRYSYRGLSRHQLRPMPGVPNALVRTQTTLRFVCAAQLKRSSRRSAP